ncbi:MAG: hypothetical protein ACM3Y9_15175 [Ignavibacteria bacterium]
MAEDGKDPKNAGSGDPSRLRDQMGARIVYYSLAVLAVLGVAAIVATMWFSDAEARFGHIKDILGILLPVLGTWVGTVLAFYFSRENFAAAAEHTRDLVSQLTPDQKLQGIPVTQAMIAMDAADTVKLVLAKPEDQVRLKADILDTFLPEGARNRLPCVDATGKAKYVFHRSIIEGFIARTALEQPGQDLTALTLKDLLASDRVQQIVTAFGVVAKSANLSAAKAQIDSNPDCSDVFVTEDGTRNGKAVGWITNVVVAEKSRI